VRGLAEDFPEVIDNPIRQVLCDGIASEPPVQKRADEQIHRKLRVNLFAQFARPDRSPDDSLYQVAAGLKCEIVQSAREILVAHGIPDDARPDACQLVAALCAREETQ